jgi:PAS domain S-box-containing protein
VTELSNDRRADAVAELFEGPGEVRALARTLDWGATPLGWPDTWSPALRIVTRAMLDAPFPICLWCGREYALVYNDAYRRVLAAKHPAALGRPGSQVWAEIWGEIEWQFAQVRGGGAPTYFENARFEMARLEGGGVENAWFSYSLSAVRDEDGSIPAVLNIAPETTSRVLTDHVLAVERARLEQVFRRAPSFIVALRGADQVYEFVNEAYYQLIGHRDVLGKPLLEALPEIGGQGFKELLDRVRETGEPWVGRESPVELQRTPGAPLETRYLDMVFQPLTEADGTRSGVVAHGSDITEQVLARREVERARDRANRLQELTAALAATRTREEVGEIAVAQGVAASGAMTGVITLRVESATDDAPVELAVLRQSGVPSDLLATYSHIALDGPTPTARTVGTGSPFFLENREELFATFPELAHVWEFLGMQALVTVPLTVGGEAVGGLSFSFSAPHTLPAEDREFFLALGRQVAQALERVRLGEAEHIARGRAESLQRVTAALAQARTLIDVGRVFSQELTAIADARMAWVGLLDADGTAIDALSWSGFPESTVEHLRRMPMEAGLAVGEAVRTSRPQWFPNREAIIAAYPARAPLVRALEQNAAAVLPILTEGEQGTNDPRAGRAIGGIVVGFGTPQRFDAGQRTFFLALAQQCALAIERARSYEAEQVARVEAESARRAAEAASRAKSEFLAVMSHELRTPLNAIGGYAELMEMGLRGPVSAEQQSDLERIQRAQRHLLGLINGVLNYARVDAGVVDYDITDVAVDEVLAACEVLVAPQTRAKGLGLHHEPCDATLAVRADRDKVQQIVLNLLSNAVKFTSPGGRVAFGCARRGNGVVIHVSDTGRGIAADNLERVFQPFVQVDATLTRTQEGTGLGLAISRDLARGMGGDLMVESTVGVGSTFTLTLPG